MAERNTDTVPAMLTPGEFVVTKDAVENAGGPGFFYWLMNALDPGSKKPREDGYQHGGIVHSLLSRTQKKDKGPIYPKPDLTIPAGKNILGQPTEEMGPEEFMEMFMPSGGAPVVGMAKQIGKEGLKNLIQGRKPKIIKALEKMQETGSSPKVSKKVAEDIQWQEYLYDLYRKSTTRGSTSTIIKKQKKQRGGSIDDYSLMDYMMPAMDKRLGKPLMKFEHGGQVRQPGETGYYHYMEEMGNATGAAPPASSSDSSDFEDVTGTLTQSAGAGLSSGPLQGQLIQPSTSTSTGIASIFEEMGFKTPGAEYLSTVQAYDPTQQNRLRGKIGRGMSGVEKSSFAGSGAERRDIGQKRDLLTEQYQMGAGDYRKQYREDVMAGVLDDLTQGTYDFEDLA